MTTRVRQENLQIEGTTTAAARRNFSDISSKLITLFDGVSFLKSGEIKTQRGPLTSSLSVLAAWWRPRQRLDHSPPPSPINVSEKNRKQDQIFLPLSLLFFLSFFFQTSLSMGNFPRTTPLLFYRDMCPLRTLWVVFLKAKRKRKRKGKGGWDEEEEEEGLVGDTPAGNGRQ